VTSRALLRALARAGLQPVGAGAGEGVRRLTATDAEGTTWTVTVVPADETTPARRADLRRRVAALAGVAHPHVARLAPLLELRDGTAAVLQADVPGADLATVRAARGPWEPGEVVTVVVPLAQALAALHAVGVAHGDVAPGNVVLAPGGRPVLVDLVHGADDAEAGTPGYAAPERVAGRAGATPAGDLHALGRLGLALLDGPAARPDDARDGGSPETAALRRVLLAAADPDPDRRPSAARLAADAYAACPPRPVAMPDAAALAPLTLRRLAAPPDEATVRTPAREPRRGRHRRPGPVRGPLVVLATGLAAAVLVGALLRADPGGSPAAAEPGGAASDPPAVSAPGPGAPDPALAAARLTHRRVAALVAGNPAALASVTLPGSPAAAADLALAARTWRDGPARRVGGGAEVLAVGPRDVSAATARVRVTARAWVTDERAPEPGAGPRVAPRSVVLALVRSPDGWRVSAVEAP
jgi:hypothetical protein